MNEVALRYAESLFSLALESRQVETWQDEVKCLRKILRENEEFLNVLSSAFISLKEKEEIVDRTLRSFNSNLVALVKVVIKNHRVSEFDNILLSYNSLANEYRGVKEGLIYSTVKLDETTKEKIEAEIGKLEKSKVELIPVIDPSLIGGIKVVINDHIYDDSIKHHLDEMENKLLRK